MIIDIHTHLPFYKIFPPSFVDNVAKGLVGDDPKKGEFIRRLVKANLSDHDGSKFVDLMDECAIQKSILLIADFGYAMGEAELSLEEIYELHFEILDKYPDRFVLFTGVDPRRGKKGLDLFEESVASGKSSGLKLYPPCGFELDDRELYPYYEICQEYKIPVQSHTGPSFPVLRTERKYPGSLKTISDDFKEVNFILGHGGALNWESNTEVAKTRDNVYLEMSTYQTYISDASELESRLRFFMDTIPNQILFGSDWPMFALGATLQDIVGTIKKVNGINSEEKEKLFYKNAKYLLNL